LILNLFKEQISSLDDWAKIFESIHVFMPLIEYIFRKERLELARIENLTSGTNAVFRAGDYVVKIFAPMEAGIEVGADINTELFGIKRAVALGIPTPKLIASGEIVDKYNFHYMITEYLNAASFREIKNSLSLSYEEKIVFGQKLRKITDRLNTPCENFDPIEVIQSAMNNNEWANYPDSFIQERLSYLANMCVDERAKVYCHGDLNADNIFVDGNFDSLYIIDFADGMYVPAGYEEALIACELFGFERPYMLGYFGEYSIESIVDLCARWLPVHDSGMYILRDKVGPAEEIRSLAVMKERLFRRVKLGRVR